MRVDVLFINGEIHTFDPHVPRASTMAVLGGRLIAVGDADLAAQFEAGRVVDLGGRTVVPGFNDAHNHMVFFGMNLADVDCSSPPMKSVRDICDAIRARAAETPEGGWVTGSGYDQNKLAEGRHPHARELDEAAPNHKVWLKHTSGHMCTVNTAVLDMIRDTPVPSGGELGRDADGALDGLVMEQAQAMVRDLVYPLPVDRIVDAIDQASTHYLSEGVTSATEAGVGAGLVSHSPVEIAAWMAARKRGVLGVRVNMLVAVEALHHISHAEGEETMFGLDGGIHSGLGDEWLRIGGTKIFSDGSLIGRTAAMFDPFEGGGHECNCGFFQTEPEVLHRLIVDAHRSGWQVCTHAIGDRAVATVLDAYEDAQRRYPRADTRHRIEHCGVLQERLLDKVKNLGVIPVPQGRFISEIGDGMKNALGIHRTPDAYRQKSFLDRGIPLPGSSDRPVVNGAPLLGIHDMVNQKTATGEDFVPGEAITAEQAFSAYTRGSAFAAFEERVKGSLTPGMLADFVVLGANPFTIDRDGIGETPVDATIVGGEIAFDAVGIGN